MSSSEYLLVEVSQQPIELCKLLKIADLVSGGGEAKVVISEGYVFLNGEVEYQKRKKIYHQDVIEFNGEVIQLMVNEALNDLDYEPPVENSQPAMDNQAVMDSQSVMNKQDFMDNQPEEMPSNTPKAKQKPRQNKSSNKKQNKDEQIKTPSSPTGRKRKPISF